jgi:hypothetical protein
MNERIIELANKANKDIGYTFKMEEAKQLHELMKKFAELLISEVMKVVRDEVQYEYDWALADIVTERVKKEFGV